MGRLNRKLSEVLILLIYVITPTIVVGIFTIISKINTLSECFKARKMFIFSVLCFYEQLKFHAQFSISQVL